MNIPHKINFTRKFEEDDVQQCFLLPKNGKKIFKTLLWFINCNRIIYAMEHQKISNILNEASDSKFLKRILNIVNNQSNANYSVGNKIMYIPEMLKSNLCGYSDA